MGRQIHNADVLGLPYLLIALYLVVEFPKSEWIDESKWIVRNVGVAVPRLRIHTVHT